MKPGIELRSLYFAAKGFPSLDQLRKRGWQTPGGDNSLIKLSLTKTVGDHTVNLVQSHDGLMGVIYPTSLDPKAPGLTETEALAAVAAIYEELEG